MIYFDNAATSRFKPKAAIDAATAEMRVSANSGRGGHRDALAASERLYAARKAVLNLAGADDGYEAVFGLNCTDCANLALLGTIARLPGKPAVITTSNDHNAVLRPLFELQRAGRCEVVVVDPGKDGVIDAKAVENALTPDVKLIAVNHIGNVTGEICDVEAVGALAKKRGVMFFVDGAQSLGHVPIDVKRFGVTFLAGAGHKALHGVQGAGFLIFDRECQPFPIRFGGTGTDSDSVLQPDAPPEAFEAGTVAMPAISALREGIKWTETNFNAITRKTAFLSEELWRGLKSIGVEIYSPRPSSVISFNISGLTSSETADLLDKKNIAVRAGLHCAPLVHKRLGTLKTGAVRASLGCCNDLKDVNALLSAVENLKKQFG